MEDKDTGSNSEEILLKESQSGLTPRSLAIGLFILFIWGIISIFSGNFGSAPQIFIEELSVLFPFFLLIFGLRLLEKIKIHGKRLAKQELTFIWAMLIVGIPITNSGFLGGRLLLNAMFTRENEPLSPPTGWAPTFWAPPLDEINRAYPGGNTPDLSLWLIPLLYWGITTLAWAFMSLFLIQIFRKPWVDVERLSFPLSQPVIELLNVEDAKKPEKRSRYLFLAIGMILAITWTSFEFLRTVFNIYIIDDFMPFDIVPGRAWDIKIDLGKEFGLSAFLPNAYLVARPEPAMIAALILVSLNVLLSGIIFYLLFWVIIPVFETEIGIIAPPTTIASPVDIDLGFGRLGGISLFAFGEFGMLFGVAFWAIILQRKYLIRTIKAIWDPSIIDESNEPISYRKAWMGLIITTSIFFLSLYISGAPLIGALYIVLFLLVGYIAGARLRAETAGMGIGHPGYIHLHGMHSVRVIIGEENANSPGFYVTSMWVQFFQRDAAPATPAVSALESYNIARVTKTSAKDIMIGHSVAIIAIIIMLLILWPIFAYLYGLNNEWSGQAGHNLDYSESSLELAKGGYWDNKTYGIDIWGQAIMGTVFAIALNIIRLSSPWLPLNPIAAPILLSLRGGYWWLPILIAYIIKLSFVRVGGSRAFSNYLLPAAVGYLIGTAGMWGYTLIVLMLPAIFPFINAILGDAYLILAGLIWLLAIISIIAYIIIKIMK